MDMLIVVCGEENLDVIVEDCSGLRVFWVLGYTVAEMKV